MDVWCSEKRQALPNELFFIIDGLLAESKAKSEKGESGVTRR
jgi:hypothetical protein